MSVHLSLSRRLLWGIVAAALGLAGCGTIRTAQYLDDPGYPRIYSGTRMDFHALTQNDECLKKMKVEPPKHPLIDLPFSLLLDTLILPETIPVSTYELLFE